MKNREFYLPLSIGGGLTAAAGAATCFFSPVGAAVCLLLGAALLAVFAFYTKRRYRRLAELNDYLSRVCGGDYSLEIGGNAEGELSILQNNLYKVITTLRSQKEVIEKDRTYLADSLADISHQLKTPLTSVIMMTDLLANEEDAGKRREFSRVAGEQCEKMRWLVGTLLKLSKLDAGTAEFLCAPQRIGAVVGESLKPFLLTLELRGITVEKEIADFGFNGDKNWTVEAIQNIVKNCIEHTPDGGRLRISASDTTLFGRLVIEDNGCGIAPEDLPHIFERFYHGKDASAESVGIGLALSKTILAKENASIEARSVPGEGAAFEIRFYHAVV